MKLLIKNGIVKDFKNNINEKMDILIEDGKIVETGDIDKKDIEILDANNLVIVPGFVDVHCHLRDPGNEYKVDIKSGCASAAKGGFTAVMCMPNTDPVNDNESITKYIIEKAKMQKSVKVYPVGSITKGLKGEELSEIGTLKNAGCLAVSDDGRPVENALIMKRAMEYSTDFDMPVISHCEDISLVDGGVMNEGFMSSYLGLKGIPASSEELMVFREVKLAQETKAKVHIAHISTRGSVDIIRQAKKKNIDVTCETCPHYFTLSDENLSDYDTNYKMNPPLRTKDDKEAIIEGLKDGTIDILATDHAPHHKDEKNVEFGYAANGITGFETAFSLAYTKLVETDVLSLERLIYLMSYNPRNRFGLENKGIKAGSIADLTIIDLASEYTYKKDQTFSKSKNTPFDNFKLKGQVKYTIVDGNIVYGQGE